MPEFIEIDISHLELGKSVKVEDILSEQYEILNSPLVSVVSVNIPRVTIEEEQEEETEDDEETEGEEGTEGDKEGSKGRTESDKTKSKDSEGDKKEESKD